MEGVGFLLLNMFVLEISHKCSRTFAISQDSYRGSFPHPSIIRACELLPYTIWRQQLREFVCFSGRGY